MFKIYEYKKNIKLANLSTVKIGGIAKWIVYPKNTTELREIYAIAKQNNLKSFVIGNCSNILFDDEGFDGVLISLKNFNKIKKIGDYVFVGAGINLFTLNIALSKLSLSGLEWSYGIPGSLGGLIYMNGGSFGHEICEFLEEVVVLNEDRIKRLKRDQINFQYRKSNLENCVILIAKLRLKHEKTESVFKKMQKFYENKKKTQPCDMPSLGSVFKHIKRDGEIVFPAKVIDELGLKGYSIGGAQISQKHAGFIVNNGNATSQDFKDLLDEICEKFREKNLNLEKEIVILEK